MLGEFDGRVKYGRLLRPGQEPGDAVFEEKRREDAIRDEGWGVVRWVWSDLQVPHRLADPGTASAGTQRSVPLVTATGVLFALRESCRTPEPRTTLQ